jgi:hypothetical protein
MEGTDVSYRTPRISRRKLLQISGLAPLAAVAVPGASRAEVAAVAGKVDDLSPGALEELVRKSKLTDPSQVAKFREVANELWRYFQLGAHEGGLPFPDPDPEGKKDELAKAAYDVENRGKQKSGDLIVGKVAAWAEQREVTNVCAYLCGYHSAKSAQDLGQDVITEDAYRHGFRRTEREMKTKMDRLRAFLESQGRDTGSILGGGC